MLLFLVLFLVSALVALGFLAFGGKRVTLKEFGLQMGVQLVACAILAACSYCRSTGDTETLNGRVTIKAYEHVSCEHSYDCFCRTEGSGSGKNRSCDRVCQTCYEHSYDVDWNVGTTIGNFTIDRVDRQGLREPPRWAQVQPGEPVARTHGYTNYVKGNPDSLFRRDGDYERFKATLPAYPQRVYDYWHMDRLVQVGVQLEDPPSVWNPLLEAINMDLGPSKQANVVLVVVQGQPHEWFYALQQAWLGGKKNDIVVVIGVDAGQNIVWTDVMAWASDSIVKVKLRDDLPAGQHLKPVIVYSVLMPDVRQYFQRKPMADFKYLEDAVKPTATAWAVTLIISLLVALGMGVFVYENDVFDEEQWFKRGTYDGGPS